MFLLADNPGRVGTTYTTYVGKDNVPSVTGATMCILTDSNGYATLVVVSNYQLATNTFVAYVTDSNVDVSNYLGNGYFVYKVGETTPTTVYDASAAVLGTNAPTGAIAWSTTAHGTGLYTFIVNANDQITSMQPYVCDLHCDESYSTGTYDRSVVKAAVKDGSFQTQGYDNLAMNAGTGYTVTTTAAVKDFNVTNDTVVINVTKNNINSDAVLSVGALSDITAGSVVLVKYNTVGSKYTATVVYVINIGSTGVNPGADAWAIFPVGTSYVEYNNTTLQVYVNDPYLTVADLANAFGTASGGYYVTSGGITTYMAVSATSTNTVLSVMAQNQATITVTNAFGVTYTVVTSK